MNQLFQRVHQIDTLAFVWLHVTKNLPYRRSVRWLSRSGDGYLYALIALTVWGLSPIPGEQFALACAVAFALELSLYWVLKNAIKRNRPAIVITTCQPWIIPSDRFSFPSGHTAAAFVFAGLVATFYPAFAPVCYIWATLIGVSRVLLGVHYPSDIVAGMVLGTACAFFSVTAVVGLT